MYTSPLRTYGPVHIGDPCSTVYRHIFAAHIRSPHLACILEVHVVCVSWLVELEHQIVVISPPPPSFVI